MVHLGTNPRRKRIDSQLPWEKIGLTKQDKRHHTCTCKLLPATRLFCGLWSSCQMSDNKDHAKKSLFENVSLAPLPVGHHLTTITVYALSGENPLACRWNRIRSFRGEGQCYVDQLNARNVQPWVAVLILAWTGFYWDTTGGTGQIKCYRWVIVWRKCWAKYVHLF